MNSRIGENKPGPVEVAVAAPVPEADAAPLPVFPVPDPFAEPAPVALEPASTVLVALPPDPLDLAEPLSDPAPPVAFADPAP